MAVIGHLQDVALVDLVQLNCQTGATGRLLVQDNGRVGQIYFADGMVVHALVGDREGKEAFYDLVGWDQGHFEMQPGLVAPARTISTHYSDLVLAGMQKLDEGNGHRPPAVSEVPAEQASPEDLGALFGFEQALDSGDQARVQEVDEMVQSMQELLAELGQEIPGMSTAAVVGMDGLPIAQYSARGTNVDAVSAQLAMYIKLVETTVKKVGAGTLEDTLLSTEEMYVLMGVLGNSGYFLGISASRKDANLGNMRLFSRLYAKKILNVLPR